MYPAGVHPFGSQRPTTNTGPIKFGISTPPKLDGQAPLSELTADTLEISSKSKVETHEQPESPVGTGAITSTDIEETTASSQPEDIKAAATPLEETDFDAILDELDLDELDEDDKEPSQLLVEKAKLMNFEDPTAETVATLRSKTAREIRNILYRPHINSIILNADDSRLEQGVLSQLQKDLGESPIIELDCDDIEPNDEGFFKSRKLEYQLPKAIEEAWPNLLSKLNVTTTPEQPFVLILRNVNEEELENLQDSKVYRELQEKHPNLRLIIPTVSDADEKASKPFSFFDDEPSKGAWRAGQFQVINIPTLKPEEWAKVLATDPKAQQILDFWKLNANDDVLAEFLTTLRRESQNGNASFTYNALLAELDALGSSVNGTPKTQQTLTKDDIKTYANKVLQPRRTKVSKPKSSQNDSGPLPYDIINASDIKVTLDDVVGHNDVKNLLKDILKEAKYPKFYSHINEQDEDASLNFVLLSGEPGDGKTFMARCLAGEGKAGVISTSGSRFVELYVGSGAKNVRKTFDAVDEMDEDLVILFIDEIDAVGNRENGSAGAGATEQTQTINEMLARMDGMKRTNKKLIVIGATNHPENIDPAILSRFHHKVKLEKLDKNQRKMLIERQMEQKKLTAASNLDSDDLARMTRGFSGRDIRNMMKQAKKEPLSRVDDKTMSELENNPDKLEKFTLKVTQQDMVDAIREIKKGWRSTTWAEKKASPHQGPFVLTA